MKHQIALEDFLNDMAVIRTTFETLDLFPSDDPIAAELKEMITEAQRNLIRGYGEVCEAIRTYPAMLPFSIRDFQIKMTLGCMTKGLDTKALNRCLKTNAFDEGENSLYYFEAAELIDMKAARHMPCKAFVLLIFNEMLHQVKKPENYENKQTFDREIFQKYLSILYVAYSVMECAPFYRRDLR